MKNTSLLSALLAAGLAAPAASFPAPAAAQEVPLHAGSTLRFASVAEGAAVLGREDEFTQSLSRFDLQSRLKTQGEATVKDLLAFAARQVEPWTPEEIAALTPLVESLQQRLAGFPPLFPKTVLLIKTTGEEEAGAAYCRGQAVVLPRSMVRRPPVSLERLLAHELFHILSRHDPQRRDRLYAIVGFRPCGEIELPPALRDRKITNPDAPTIRHLVELRTERGVVPAAPILFASVESYDPAHGDTFFQVMQFRLLQLAPHGEHWKPALDAQGQPILLDPRQTPAYLDQVGHNTNYIIHPEEVLADNFAHLLLNTPDLQTPKILDDLRRILRSHP